MKFSIVLSLLTLTPALPSVAFAAPKPIALTAITQMAITALLNDPAGVRELQATRDDIELSAVFSQQAAPTDSGDASIPVRTTVTRFYFVAGKNALVLTQTVKTAGELIGQIVEHRIVPSAAIANEVRDLKSAKDIRVVEILLQHPSLAVEIVKHLSRGRPANVVSTVSRISKTENRYILKTLERSGRVLTPGPVVTLREKSKAVTYTIQAGRP